MDKTKPILIVAILGSLMSTIEVQGLICGRGHIVHKPQDGPEVCESCEDGVTYMSEDRHNKTRCYKCSDIMDTNTEVRIRDCNRNHNTVIICKSGYFRQNGVCRKCTICEHEIHRCESFSNAICCDTDHFYIHINHDGSKECKVRTLWCKQEEFYDVSSHQCLPCPDKTYMHEVHHNYTACYLCGNFTGNRDQQGYEYILRACSITHPDDNGYFGNPESHDSPILKCADISERQKLCCFLSNETVNEIEHQDAIGNMNMTVSITGDNFTINTSTPCISEIDVFKVVFMVIVDFLYFVILVLVCHMYIHFQAQCLWIRCLRCKFHPFIHMICMVMVGSLLSSILYFVMSFIDPLLDFNKWLYLFTECWIKFMFLLSISQLWPLQPRSLSYVDREEEHYFIWSAE